MTWQGEYAFGPVWAAFRGGTAENRLHAHAAIQVVIGQLPVTLETSSGMHSFEHGCLIQSGVRHSLGAAAQQTLVFLEPQSSLAVNLTKNVGGDAVCALPGHLAEPLRACAPLAECVRRFERGLPGHATIDPRLQAALSFLEAGAPGLTIAAAASHCGVSPARLRALAHEQFGVPLKKLLLWRMVRRACEAMAFGSGLADAANVGGFADQAHFTRTMSEVIGITPNFAKKALDG